MALKIINLEEQLKKKEAKLLARDAAEQVVEDITSAGGVATFRRETSPRPARGAV